MINYLKSLLCKPAKKEKRVFTQRIFFDRITVNFFDLMRDPEEYMFESGRYRLNVSDGFLTIYCQGGKEWEGKRWVRSINQTAVSSIEIDEATKFIDEKIEYEV